MRAQSDPWYSDFLLRISNGREESDANDYVRLPDDIMVEYNSDESIDVLIKHVFPYLKGNCTSSKYMQEQAILSTRNEHVDAMNARMIKHSREMKRCNSAMTQSMMTLAIPTHLIF
jgi:hypothetical protein